MSKPGGDLNKENKKTEKGSTTGGDNDLSSQIETKQADENCCIDNT